VHQELAAAEAALASPDGRLLLSGFREADETMLLPCFQRQGWRLRERAVKYFSHPELPPTFNFNWVAWLLERDRPAASAGPAGGLGRLSGQRGQQIREN